MFHHENIIKIKKVKNYKFKNYFFQLFIVVSLKVILKYILNFKGTDFVWKFLSWNFILMCPGGTETYEEFFMGTAHFKDIALAHILAFEKKEASGRHLCVEAIRHYGDFVAKVAELYPEYNVAK